MASLLSLAGGFMGGFLDSMKSPVAREADNPDTSIQVCVRIRPMLRNENDGKDTYAWNWEDKTMYPQLAGQQPYTFDHLFFPESSNEDIFNGVVKKVVLQSMNGYNSSIFTYGQTASGKTFTMNGSHSQPGIIPQAIYYCFKSIQDSFPDREFLFRVSYIEVYNEQLKDLLNSEPAHIKIQYDPKVGTILKGVKEQVVLSPQQVIALIRAGEAQRHVGATDMNETSSRAHTLFKLIIESRKRGDSTDAPVRVSFLNLIDLAGSENAKMTNSTGERAKEAKHINQSLLTLSLIIHRLSEEKSAPNKKQYFPYRDSKLTRLLQSSLSGNAKIAVICTVSPTLRCVDETHNTLRFATRAKKIKTNAAVNELMDDKTLLKAYKMEINCLRARLSLMEHTQVQTTPLMQIMNGLRDPSAGGGSLDDLDNSVDDSEVESEGLILQMISEMERLILKADIVGAELPDNAAKLLPRKKSIGPPLAPSSPAPRRSPTERMSSPTGSAGRSVKGSNKMGSPPPDKILKSARKGSTPKSTSSAASAWKASASLDQEPAGSETTKESTALSDSTSIDDFFDATANSDNGDDASKSTVNGGFSFHHNQYMKRPDGLENMREGEYSRTIDPPEDCKSLHPVAKEYLKAINIGNTPRSSIKSVGSIDQSRSGTPRALPDPLRRASSSSGSKPTVRKFGFIPSPSLNRALSKVAKDAERSNSAGRSSRRSGIASASQSNKEPHDTNAEVQEGNYGDYHHRRSSVRAESTKGDGIDAPNNVLFDVSQMLNLLKKHVEKSSVARRKSTGVNADGTALSPSSSSRNILCLNNEESPHRIGSVSMDRVGGQSSSESKHTSSFQSGYGHVEDDLTRRTMGTDERAYLLEEIEKKDNMLSMLTDGLREVEISQDQWLTENEMLSKELEQALEQNQELNEDILELKQALMIREKQLVYISGVLPSYEDF